MGKTTRGTDIPVVSGKGVFARAIEAGSENARQRHEKDVRDKLIELHSGMYSGAAAYDNGVILAGYVAFFALWAGSNKDISQLCRLVTVALMGASLLFYMAWHIIQMLTRQRFEWKMADAFKHTSDPQRFNREYYATDQARVVASARLMRLWPWIFVPAVGLGFLGGGVLTYNVLARILGWPELAN